MFGWMITFYLLAHGMKPDAYLSDRQSDSVDEEALMCRMGWKTEKDKENYSKETALTARLGKGNYENPMHGWADWIELDGISLVFIDSWKKKMIFGHQLPDVTHLTARLFLSAPTSKSARNFFKYDTTVVALTSNQAVRSGTQTPEKDTSRLPLAAGGPDVADVAITLAEAVQGVIALATGTDEAAESIALVLAGVATVLVDLADGDLDGGVVVGLDDAVGGAALAGDVAVGKERERLVLCVLQYSMLLVHGYLLLLLVSGNREETLRKRIILQQSLDEG
jgi:hypothetical protein